VRLPAGWAVTLDGEDVGTTPLTSRQVEPGSHAVTVTSPCGTHVATVEVATDEQDEQVDLTDAAFDDLTLVTFTADVTALDGTPLVPSLHVGDWLATPSGKGWQLPACSLRIRLSAPDLGGFIEDIDLSDGKSVHRSVVLAPGSDLVRVHGGTYVWGPLPEDMAYYRANEEGSTLGEDFPLRNRNETVATFDMDRTEVTTTQYLACVDAGGCALTWDEVKKLGMWANRGRECNLDWEFGPRSKRGVRVIEPGHEDHPVDCVSLMEAERYCAWAGKRLPTDVEWEFAARSRKTAYKWPWGNDQSTCRAHSKSWPDQEQVCRGYKDTAPPCSHPAGNSEQGICDLVGNVEDLVVFPATHPLQGYHCERGGAYSSGMDVFYRACSEPDDERGRVRERPGIGFRCVRSVETQR
jgi:formylglycine-generating enzyme required for sulfatase activity